jgi:hypothetical protein
MFPLFATGVVDTGGKFSAPGANLPLVKHHQRYWWQNFSVGGKFAISVVDTSSKCATGVANIGGAP